MYFIPNRIFWHFHLRKIYLIYGQNLTVFHWEQSVHAYSDDVLTMTAYSAQAHPQRSVIHRQHWSKGHWQHLRRGGGRGLASSSGLRWKGWRCWRVWNRDSSRWLCQQCGQHRRGRQGQGQGDRSQGKLWTKIIAAKGEKEADLNNI